MKRRILICFLFTSIISAATACIPATVGPGGTATQTAAIPPDQPPTPTTTLAPEPLPPDVPSPTPTPPADSGQQFIAYIRDGQLLVTDVTNGAQGGTTQYTLEGESDQVTDLVWSPSGEYVAFVSPAQGELHLFYIFALGQSSPVDLGPGSAPAWSPDSQFIAYVRGGYPDDNIWITTIEDPAPRQLTFETNYAWGRPAFTPGGDALIVAGADRDFVGAQGNTSFTLERLSLDGSGTRAPFPNTITIDGARLPNDVRFSPHGSRLAFSTSSHINACGAPGAYYFSYTDGAALRDMISPSLQSAVDPGQEHYHVGLNYTWTTTDDTLVVVGSVVDCNLNSPNVGQALAGPQMSILALNGVERLVIPGTFHSLSMDRTGAWIAAAHYQDYQDLNPMVEIYSAQTGQLVLSLGPGSSPQLQP